MPSITLNSFDPSGSSGSSDFFVPDFTYSVVLPTADDKESFARNMLALQDGVSQLLPRLEGDKPASADDFFRAFNERLADNVKNFTKPPIFYGVLSKNSGKGQKRFIILEAVDFGQAQSGMLKAERTLYTDMFDVFGLPNASSDDKNIDIKNFVDGDSIKTPMRILFDNHKNSVLIYGFVDNFLIFTTDTDTFDAIRDRLRAKS